MHITHDFEGGRAQACQAVHRDNSVEMFLLRAGWVIFSVRRTAGSSSLFISTIPRPSLTGMSWLTRHSLSRETLVTAWVSWPGARVNLEQEEKCSGQKIIDGGGQGAGGQVKRVGYN